MPSEAIHERLLALQKQLTFVTAVNSITNKRINATRLFIGKISIISSKLI